MTHVCDFFKNDSFFVEFCLLLRMSNYTLTHLSPSSDEFNKIAEHASRANPEECIISIERINNPNVLASYEQRLTDLVARYDVVNQREVFHGSRNVTNYDKILEGGFKAEFAKVCAYGKGVYFADAYQYSKSYSSKKQDGDYHIMLVCEIMYTKLVRGSSNLVMKDEAKDQGCIFVDNIKSPTIFSVPTNSQMMPKYLIQFYTGK